MLASKILAKALVEEGKFVKAIPSFGFERRGAPVEAYLRFDNKTIRQNTDEAPRNTEKETSGIP